MPDFTMRPHIDKIKEGLLGVQWVSDFNRLWKIRQLKSGWIKLERSHAAWAHQVGYRYDEQRAVDAARQAMRHRCPEREAKPAGTLRIYWVGANRDQDESGFLQALRQLASVIEFRRADGAYGQSFWDASGRVRVYDPDITAANDRCLLSQLNQALTEGPVDLLMGQMWGNYLSVDALAQVQRRGIPVWNVSMDDRLPDNWTWRQGVRMGAVGLAPVTDLVLTTSPETCEWFGLEGAPAIFWPLASDPGVFRPVAGAVRDIDVLFVGNKYGIRQTIVEGLSARGIQVECWGGGWSNGPATAEQCSNLFKRARIILGVGTIGYCTDVYTLKLRDFDAPMAGALYLTHRADVLLRIFEEGREIECYADIDECASKIKHYLAHPQALAAVANAGMSKAVAQHTWLHRLTETFQRLGVMR
jgi:spore maturation protein CgeB